MKKEIFLLAVLLICFATNAFAQPPTLQDESGLGLSRVLAYAGVAKELGMDEVQVDQLNGLWTQVQFKLRYKFRDYRDNFSSTLSAPQQEQVTQELHDAIKEVREYETERLEEVLSSSQINRLKQIRMQAMDRKGGNLNQMKEELKLSDGQLEQVEGLKKEMQEAISELRKDAKIEGLTRNEIKDSTEEINSEFKDKFRDILSSSQQSTLDRLKGREFEFQVGAAKAKKEDAQ